MESDGIFKTLIAKLVVVLPHLESVSITRSHSLQALGANSMDRAEIIIDTMAAYQLRLPMLRFGQAKNIGDIVDIIAQGLDEQCQNQVVN